jgi:hypothetical protein
VQTFNRWIITVAFVLAVGLGQIAHAQEAKEAPIHPDQTIKLEVKFDGPDAGAFNVVIPSLYLVGAVPAKQTGFGTNIPGSCTKSGQNTFDCDLPVSSGAATGDYTLTLDARADGIRVIYESGKQFQLHPFHIENPRTFTAPSVTVKQR